MGVWSYRLCRGANPRRPQATAHDVDRRVYSLSPFWSVSHPTPATQCRSNPVSGRGLPKTGIFQIPAGDYRLFRTKTPQIRGLETHNQFTKARRWRAFLAFLRVKSPGAGLVGWGGRIRTLRWW